ncbi:RDD family protein [Marisediminicola senii]|uniref:RDD family protein n=1 Tax=Marisediminicola senii TaxID=2711233 RepID=UPI0013EC9D33|nr:RDD family protein [Marisediminicola senii]
MPQRIALDDDHADDDELVTGEAVALDLRSSSFVLRGAGAIIDFLTTVVLVVGVLLLISSPAIGLSLDEATLQAVTIALIVTVTIALPTAVETITHGKSLGKWAIGARVVRDDGGSIGFRHALIRALTGFLEIYMTIGGFAAMFGLLNTRSKRLGDLLAGTYSQNERVKRIEDPVFTVPPELSEWATVADVARMPDRLSRRISSFLLQASAMLPPARDRVGRELAAEAAPYVSPVPSAHPEALLLAITAIRRDREFAALQLEQERREQLAPVLGGLPHGFPVRE